MSDRKYGKGWQEDLPVTLLWRAPPPWTRWPRYRSLPIVTSGCNASGSGRSDRGGRLSCGKRSVRCVRRVQWLVRSRMVLTSPWGSSVVGRRRYRRAIRSSSGCVQRSWMVSRWSCRWLRYRHRYAHDARHRVWWNTGRWLWC